jgi:hypothetical protein
MNSSNAGPTSAQVGRTATSLWQAMIDRMNADFSMRPPTALFESLGMLGLTARTFDSGNHLAASLVCRSAVEATGYLFLTRRATGPNSHVLIWPKTLSGDVRRVQFEEILEALKSRKVLSTDLSTKARIIKEHGNFIAHFASRQDVQFARWLEESGGGPPTGPIGRPAYPYPTVEEVFRDIEAACKIFLALTAAWAEGKGGPLKEPHETNSKALKHHANE